MKQSMKRRVVIFASTILFLAILIIVAVFCGWKKQEQQEKQEKEQMEYMYFYQNLAFPRTEGNTFEYKYFGYESIDKAEMFIRLKVYNNQRLERGEELLTLEDIEEYLSSEYNSDGSPRVLYGYEHIRDYIIWYDWGGEDDVTDYWYELLTIEATNYVYPFDAEYIPVQRMSIEQLQELIKKYEDPSYEINIDILKGDN